MNNIIKNGCSINDLHHLTNYYKDFFSKGLHSNEIDDDLLSIPFFCQQVHILFDIYISGLLMHNNSNFLWAKWIVNRLIWYNLLPPQSFYSNEIVSLVHKSDNPTVKALYDLRLLMVPNFVDMSSDIPLHRHLFKTTIINLVDSFHQWFDSPIVHPISTIPLFSKIPGYYLTYHNCNNSFHLHYQAKLYSLILQKVFKHSNLNILPEKRPVNQRPRIGFISRFLSNHSVGKISVGLIQGLYQNNFDIHIYTNDNKNDVIGEIISNSCTKYVNPNNVLIDWVSRIRDDNLDIFILLDPIMDINTYLIGCFRLAPVQISTWGHPDTTGLPFVDYYISSHFFEANHDDLYTEKLICLPSIGINYRHINTFLQFDSLKTIQTMDIDKLKQYYGFNDNAHLYAILSPMIKMSIEMDIIINTILNEDNDALIVIIEGKDKQLFDKVYNRLKKNVSHLDRIHIVPQQPDVFSFLKLVYCMDVILDTHPFGGCISTYECFMMGKCIVTLPGNKLYGRFTQGLYRKMGITELIAKDLHDYVQIAIQVATNTTFKTMVQNEILDKLHLIINDQESIRDWSDFLNSLLFVLR